LKNQPKTKPNISSARAPAVAGAKNMSFTLESHVDLRDNAVNSIFRVIGAPRECAIR
jgi:hypothetical protein